MNWVSFLHQKILTIALSAVVLAAHARDQHALHFAVDATHPRPHVEIAAQAPFNVTDALTVEAWVRLPAYGPGEFPPKWQAIVTKGEGWGITRYSNTNLVAFRTKVGDELHTLAGTTASELTPGTWHHVAAVWDGTTKYLYIDGELDASTPWEGPPNGNAFRVMIGANEEFPERIFEGDIDDVRVWNTARSATQIAEGLRRRPLGSEAGLLGYWRFESVEDGADGVRDSSTDEFHGVLHDIDAGSALIPDGVLVGAPLPGDYALRFDGVDDAGADTEQFVQLRNNALFDVTGRLTIECDVYIGVSHAGRAALVSKGGNAWSLNLTADRRAEFRVAGLTPDIVLSSSVLPVEEWHHLAATWDGSRLLILLDGEVDAWQSDVTGTMAVDASKRVLFGAQPPTSTPWYSFKGKLDNVRIWNAAPTPQQIAEAMGHASGGHGPGLIGTWDFNETGGTGVADGRGIIEPTSDVLDFEGASAGATVTEDGFQLAVDAGTLAIETNTGSNALYADTTGALVTLSRPDGHPFRVLSIDVADLAADTDPGTQITFEGTLADGWGTVEQTVVLSGGEEVKTSTVQLVGFANVTSVAWTQEASDHQFDSIVAHDVTGLNSEALKAHGGLVNIPVNQRVAGARDLEPALPRNYAVRFDGTDDYLAVVHAPALDLNEFTIEAWVKPETPAAGELRTILRKGDLGYGFAIDDAGHLRYFIGDGSVAQAVASTGTVVDGEWQHVAVSVSPSTNTILFYINGQPAGEIEANDVLNNTDPLVLGRRGPNDDAGYFHGDLTEIRLWDSARPPDAIADFANRRLPTVIAGLIAYWDCNEGAGGIAADRTANGLDAALSSQGAGTLPQWAYGPSAPLRKGQYCGYFDGVDDCLEVPHDPALNMGSAMTLEAWVRPEANATEDGLRTIAMKGDCNAEGTGYGLALDESGHLCFWVDGNVGNVISSTGTVADDEWQHVAVSVSGSTASFYINGQPAGSAGATHINDNGESLFIARQGLTDGTARNHYRGWLDELRLWNIARTPEQIADTAMGQLPGVEAGLVAYWRLNDYADYLALDEEERLEANALEATDLVNGLRAGLRNATVSAWQPGLYALDWDGPFWDTEAFPAGLNLATDPATKGLWVGTVSIVEATDIRTARSDYPGVLAPTSDVASYRILFHVDERGRTRLLKDVMIMRTVEDEEGQVEEDDLAEGVEPRLVLLTDPTLIPQFEGVVVRRGKLVGKRYGTVAYDFDGREQSCVGGLGAGRAVQGTIVLPKTHPTNPFRHKYHPDHRNVSDINPDYGYEISRTMTIEFAESLPDDVSPGGYGVDYLHGAFREVVTGLHKFPITVEGTVTLTRVCDVGVINE